MTEPAVPEFDREAYRSVRDRVREQVSAGARMIAISAWETEYGTIELVYIFDRDHKLVNFRFQVLPEWEIDSVSDIYKGALALEREVVDLFGLNIKGVGPGIFLEKGKSPIAPLRRKATVQGGEADG